MNLLDVADFILRALCGLPVGGHFHDILPNSKRTISAIYALETVIRRVVAGDTIPVVRPPPDACVSAEKEPKHNEDDPVLSEIHAMLTSRCSMCERLLLRVTSAVPEHKYNAEHIEEHGNVGDEASPGEESQQEHEEDEGIDAEDESILV